MRARCVGRYHRPMLQSKTLLVGLLAFLVGVWTATAARSHADPPPALDRPLMERLVRAQEAQVRKLEDLARVAERCNRPH